MKPKPDCEYCHGTGVVTDWVDFGSARVSMDSTCGCTAEDYPEVERCSKCGENATFTMDDSWEWLSDCCTARAVRVDVEEGT